MKVEVIKNKSARKVELAKLFPNNNLDYVSKTCEVTFEEFNNLWMNTTGKNRTGNQYSNMNKRNFLVAEDENGNVLGDTVTDEKDYGWVLHHAKACGNTEKSYAVKPLSSLTKRICRDFYSYGNENNGIHVVAQVSDCGNFVTVFKTKNHFWIR